MRPSIIPPTIVTILNFLKKKLLKCLQLMKDVGMGLLIPATLNIII